MAPASSMRLFLGGLATATIVEAAADIGASVPVTASVAVAPLAPAVPFAAPAVPVVAPARLLPLYECDVEKDNWETAWTPDWKAWCCENDASGRGCPSTSPPTTTVTPTTVTTTTITATVTTTTITTTIDAKVAAEACSSSCIVDGVSWPCSARIQWASEHTFKEKESPCGAAVDLVQSQCDACSKCTIEASGCSAAEGEEESAQEDKPEAHPEHALADKDEQDTQEAKEQHDAASESKEEEKAVIENSAHEKDVDLKADNVADTDASKVVGLGPQIDAQEEVLDDAHRQPQSDAAKEEERTEPAAQIAQASAPATTNLRKVLVAKFEEPAPMMSSTSTSSTPPRRNRVVEAFQMAIMGAAAFAVTNSVYHYVARRRLVAECELIGAGGVMVEFLRDDEEGIADGMQE